MKNDLANADEVLKSLDDKHEKNMIAKAKIIGKSFQIEIERMAYMLVSTV